MKYIISRLLIYYIIVYAMNPASKLTKDQTLKLVTTNSGIYINIHEIQIGAQKQMTGLLWV